LIVQKYGGSSVSTPGKIKKVASRIRDRVKEGEKLVVVVSAMGETTDKLIDLAREVTPDPHNREMDMLLATGEQTSAALLSMALNEMDIPAIAFNAFQLEMITTASHRNARIKDLNLTRLFRELEIHEVVVVTGFQGITEDGYLTTLGRGGSDTSAVAIATEAGKKCEIYSDVAGVYAADPRLVPNARKLKYITCDEMLELAALGAKVLHSRAVEIAKKYNVSIYCASTFSDEEGTFVVNNLPEWMEQPVVTGVTTHPDQTKVTISNLPNDSELISRLFVAMADREINIDMISTVNDNGHSYLTFTFVSGDSDMVRETVNETLGETEGWEVSRNDEVEKVSVVGVGMQSASGVAGRFFSALSKNGIKLLGTTTSEIKISVLVHKSDSLKAVSALAREFNLLEQD